MKEFIFLILRNEAVMWVVLSILIFGLTQLLKLPIKALTKKLAEKPRKRVNLLIYLIPFGLGIGLSYVYYNILPTIPELAMSFDTEFLFMGFKLGSSSIAIYGILDQLCGVKVENPYASEDGQKVISAVNGIIADGKVEQQEIVDGIKGLTKEEQEQIDKILENK